MTQRQIPKQVRNDDYEILTAEISKATFGLTPSEYKKHKGLKRQNLRDHMFSTCSASAQPLKSIATKILAA